MDEDSRGAWFRDIGKTLLRSLVSLPALLLGIILLSYVLFPVDSSLSDHRFHRVAVCTRIVSERLAEIGRSMDESDVMDVDELVRRLMEPELEIPAPNWNGVEVMREGDWVCVEFVVRDDIDADPDSPGKQVESIKVGFESLESYNKEEIESLEVQELGSGFEGE